MLFAAYLLLLPSCMKELDLEHLRPDPLLVLNGLAVEGDTLKARLTRTWFYTEVQPEVSVRNADIKLYVNGTFKGNMEWREYEDNNNGNYWYIDGIQAEIKGYYISTYCPAKGDRIRITAEADGFDPISAEVRIPEYKALSDFKVYETEVTSEYNYTYTVYYLQPTIRDDPAKEDYYLINFDYSYSGKETWDNRYGILYPDYSVDPLFTSHLTALDKILGYDWISAEYGRAFSDDLFSGKEYTVKIKTGEGYGTPPSGASFRVNLYSLNEEYYRYIKAIIEMKDGGGLNSHMSDVGLAEPVRVFSNVEGGVGILGAACRDSITVTAIRQQ